MILGIGVDSIEISRDCKSDGKRAFVHRIFTGKERRRWNTQKGEVLLILPGKKR